MDGTDHEQTGQGSADWEMRMKMVERMLAAFRFERFAYLGVCVLACGVLLWASLRLFQLGDRSGALAMFGSSGVMALALGRMLRMWNQAWKLVTGMER